MIKEKFKFYMLSPLKACTIMKQTTVVTFIFLFLQTCHALLSMFLAEKFPFMSLELECAMKKTMRIC